MPVIHRQDQEETLDKNIPAPWRTGKLIKDLELVPGQQLRVNHGLKRQLQGWILVRPRQTNGASVFEVIPPKLNRGQVLLLAATAPVTFDLWVW